MLNKIRKLAKKTNSAALAFYCSLFASPVMANQAQAMLKEPTTKMEQLGAAIGDIAPVVSILAIVIAGVAMQGGYLAKKWGILIVSGSIVVGIAGLVADFLYG